MIVSLILGGITHHYLAHDLPYCDTINDVGTIKNPYAIVMVGDEDVKVGFLKGKDSACGDIYGPISSFRLSDNFDFILGGYNTNFKEFNDRGITPPSVGGVTPVVGLNYSLPLYESETVKASFDTLFSIGIITHGVKFTF